MAKKVLNYIPKKSIIHDLSGTTKLIIFLTFSLLVGFSFDTRVLLLLLVLSLLGFVLSKIKFHEIKALSNFLVFFITVNAILLFVFDPEHGCEIYGTRTQLLHIAGKYYLTAEQLFYQFNVALKYVIGLPIAVLFISTTNPSEFASSLSQIGVPYRISYSVSLALRYIPDVQKDYHEIAQSQEARGVALGKDVRLLEKLKNSAKILLPLVLTSLDRIDIISNSMQLRSFGKNKKRTWYMKKPMTKADFMMIVFCVILFVVGLIVTYSNPANGQFKNYFNPFI